MIREASAATIFLVDSEFYAQRIFREKLNDGAKFAIDFGFADVARETAQQMIKEIPFHRLQVPSMQIAADEFSLSTYRFKSRSRFVFEPLSETEGPALLHRIGGKLRDAEVFTARAYSLLDVDAESDAYGSTLSNPFFRSSRLGHGMFHRALLVPRIFDKDHEASVKVLNESVLAIRRTPAGLDTKQEQLVREEDSRSIDALQAADIAAGFARETLDRQGFRALAAQFRRVVLNGIDLNLLKIFN